MDLAGYLERSVELFRSMAASPAAQQMEAAVRLTAQALKADKPLLVCGTGSAAAAAHQIAGELVGRFLKERRALRCISLTADSAVLAALSDEYGADAVLARQVEALGAAGGVLLAICAPGGHGPLIPAFERARALGMTIIAITGEDTDALAGWIDVLIAVPSRHKPHLQQMFACLCQYFCERVENLCLG